MTEVSFVCSDEKALFMLKASRMFDGGYRDFIDGKRVVEQLEEAKKNICGRYNYKTPLLENP